MSQDALGVMRSLLEGQIWVKTSGLLSLPYILYLFPSLVEASFLLCIKIALNVV